MTPLTTIVSAFLLALIVASFAFMGGAVPVAIPAAILLIAVIAWANYARRRSVPEHSTRRYENEKHKTEPDDPQPAGDPSTLYKGTPEARAH